MYDGTNSERKKDRSTKPLKWLFRSEQRERELHFDKAGSKIELKWPKKKKASNQPFFQKHVLSISLSITFGASCLKDLALSLERKKAKNRSARSSLTKFLVKLEERHGRKNSNKAWFSIRYLTRGRTPLLCPSPVLNGIDYITNGAFE